MFGFQSAHKVHLARSMSRKRVYLSVEALEERVVPYSLSGDAWPHPNYVTISFVPDGTVVGSVGGQPAYSNLLATFNTRFGSFSTWELQILQAAQNWAAQTNLNLFVVGDIGTAIGQGAYEQGDPNMGDIRISGYNFGGGSTALAQTELPPPGNNYSIAGDIQFNTAYTFNIGSQYDLYTVAMHELGHAFGMEHSNNDSNAVMYPTYDGIKGGLDSDDVAGIRAIYSGGNPRSPDGIMGDNGTPQTATDVTGLINSSTNTVAVGGLSLSSPQPEWFKITAPSGTVSTPQVMATSSLQSLLEPAVYVYSSTGTLLNWSDTGANNPGGGAGVTINGVTAGQVLYIEVTSTASTSFDIGEYGLALNFGTGATPFFNAPNTTTADGNPIQDSPIDNQDPPSAFGKPTMPGEDQAGLIQVTQVTQVTPAAAPVNPLALVAPSATLASTFSVFVQPQVAHSDTTFQAAALLTHSDDIDPALNGGAPDYTPVSVAMPAQVTVTAQPEQTIRDIPANTDSWAEETTAFFAANAPQAEDSGPAPNETSASMAVEAAVALAGFVAVAGEQWHPRSRPASTRKDDPVPSS